MVWVGAAIIAAGFVGSDLEWHRATRHLSAEGEARRFRVAYLWKHLAPSRYLTTEGRRHRRRSVIWLAGGIVLGLLWIVIAGAFGRAP